jgi:hypothetical protein
MPVSSVNVAAISSCAARRSGVACGVQKVTVWSVTSSSPPPEHPTSKLSAATAAMDAAMRGLNVWVMCVTPRCRGDERRCAVGVASRTPHGYADPAAS